MDMINDQDIEHMIPLTPPRDTEPLVGSPISLSPSPEAQAATMANTDNTTRNTQQRETHIGRKCSYKEFMNCQPFNFKGTEGAIGLIHWFERTGSVFSRSNCTEDCKVKFATEDELYNLTGKGNDLKTTLRRFQEVAILFPTMEPKILSKLIEVFIGGLPKAFEGTVTASKPQTLEESPLHKAPEVNDQ
ncbi:hypothetical protein Tco_0215391 [Tanacetum coccineum]